MLSYKGYNATLEVDEGEQVIYGTIIDLQDVIHFEGDTIAEAVQAFQNSVDDYLDYCQQLGRSPEKPFSGNFTVRTSPELHRSVYLAAVNAGKSLNAFVESALANSVRLIDDCHASKHT